MSIEVDYDTVRMVQDSWEIVLKIPDAALVAGEILFRKIFEIAPGAWKLFPFGQGYETPSDEMFETAEFKSHAKQVVGMLDSAVHFLGPDLSTLEESLIALGARHTTYGVLPEHYPIVGQALLATLEAALGKEVFTAELQHAWTGVYGFVTTSMLQGANEALLRLPFPTYNKDGNTTLDAYISAMLPGQKQLFYTTASPKSSTNNPKLAKLQQAGVDVLCIKKSKEDIIVGSLEKYVGRRLINVDSSDDLDLSFLCLSDDSFRVVPGASTVLDHNDSSESSARSKDDVCSTTDQDGEFCTWFQMELGTDKVVKCTPTCQFTSLPARVIQHGSDEDLKAALRQLEDFDCIPLPKKHVEINPSHALIQTLNKLRLERPGVARMVAEQVYDNCLINAGLLDEGRAMVNRINELLMMIMTNQNWN